MTADIPGDALGAALLQLASHAERLSGLDAREAGPLPGDRRRGCTTSPPRPSSVSSHDHAHQRQRSPGTPRS